MLQRITNRMSKPMGMSSGGKPPSKPDKKREVESCVPCFTPCEDAVGAMLSAHDRRVEKKRIGGEWIHVSALINGECLRALGIANLEGVTAYEKPRPADRLLWAIGKAVEAHIRNSMIGLYGARSCMGHWECACGTTQWDGMGKPKRLCPKCGLSAGYSEFNVKHERSRLSGSPDLLIQADRTDRLTVIEIKSIKVVPKGGVATGAPEFNTISAPQRGHSLQALIYRHLLKLTGHPVTDEVMVFYGAKDYVMASPYKPFIIDGTANENVKAVDNLMDMAHEYAEQIRKGKVTKKSPLCPSCTSTKAKGCPVAGSCFSRKH